MKEKSNEFKGIVIQDEVIRIVCIGKIQEQTRNATKTIQNVIDDKPT